MPVAQSVVWTKIGVVDKGWCGERWCEAEGGVGKRVVWTKGGVAQRLVWGQGVAKVLAVYPPL